MILKDLFLSMVLMFIFTSVDFATDIIKIGFRILNKLYCIGRDEYEKEQSYLLLRKSMISEKLRKLFKFRKLCAEGLHIFDIVNDSLVVTS